MRLTKLSALAVVAISLVSTNALALNRKFHPVVNDGPQNSHLNVQTPGDDSNQTVLIKEEPGPDGQVIPAGDAQVVACALKDANGDIDLTGGSSCWSPAAPAAKRTPVAAPAIVQAPSSRAASPTIRVPSLTSASVAPHVRATNAAPVARQAEGHSPALSPAHGIAQAAISTRPVRQPAAAVRTHALPNAYADMRWLEIGLFGFAAAILAAVGLALLYRLGLGGLLPMRRRDEAGEAAQDGRVPAVVRDRLPSR
jgi:hypothetical protein